MSAPVVNPYEFINDFFDPNRGYEIRKDANGDPLLSNFGQIFQYQRELPFNQIPSVTKIFPLTPAHAGVLFSGIAAVNDRSIRDLTESFVETQYDFLNGEHSMEDVATRLRDHFAVEYKAEYGGPGASFPSPTLDLLVSGYSHDQIKGEVWEVFFGRANKEGDVIQMTGPGVYEVVFGGQYDVAQRVVNGMDNRTRANFKQRIINIGDLYRDKLIQHLKDHGMSVDLPVISDFAADIGVDDMTWVAGTDLDLANFSEQAAIDFVDFLIDLMIKSQQFSARLQTVGGRIHVALITKRYGFRWLSKEEYTHQGFGTPKHPDQPSHNHHDGSN